jgi:hypothetical protein
MKHTNGLGGPSHTKFSSHRELAPRLMRSLQGRRGCAKERISAACGQNWSFGGNRTPPTPQFHLQWSASFTSVSEPILAEAHRLAWSFSRTTLLVTLEPHRLIAWSCCIDPDQPVEQRQVCELPTPARFRPTGSPEQRTVRELLHWVSLITGHYQRQLPDKFRSDGRADELLLNLRQFAASYY